MTVPVASPCINVCQMDDASGHCRGCLRTIDEIAFWSVLDDADKRAVLAEVARRRLAAQPTGGTGAGPASA